MDNERRLIRAARAGDGNAAEALVRQHFPGAWRAAYAITQRREMAEDAAQDAFERVFRNLDRFDDRRPLAPWLHRIVVNCALDSLRAERRTEPLPQSLAAGSGSDPELSADVRELFEVLGGLDPDQRTVVALRLVLGYTPRESADILGVKVGTIHSRLSRALQQVRMALGVQDAG